MSREYNNIYDLKVNNIRFLNDNKILESDDNKYFIKPRKSDLNKTFNYLNSKKFNNYLNFLNKNDKEYIFPYLDSYDANDFDKAKELIYLISILHSKTFIYESYYENELKNIYEDIINKIENIKNHYDKLRKIYEEEKIMLPSHYFLLTNISWIYTSLDSSKYFIEKWYQIIKEKKEIRKCFIHGNLELSHLIKNDESLIISWDKSRYDFPVYDLINFYNKDFDKVEFYNLFKIYENNFPLLEEEKYLLYSLMFLSNNVDYESDEVDNTMNMFFEIERLKNSTEIVSKYHSKNQDKDTNED